MQRSDMIQSYFEHKISQTSKLIGALNMILMEKFGTQDLVIKSKINSLIHEDSLAPNVELQIVIITTSLK